jgi:hypothetical protein
MIRTVGLPSAAVTRAVMRRPELPSVKQVRPLYETRSKWNCEFAGSSRAEIRTELANKLHIAFARRKAFQC